MVIADTLGSTLRSDAPARVGSAVPVLLIGVAAFGLVQSFVIPVLTTIQRDLHTTQAAVTWLLTGYLVAASVFTPILGRLGDLLGKRLVLVLTLVVLAAGCLLAALA